MPRKKKTLLEHFPYPTFRQGQQELLEEVDRIKDKFDVIALVCPTGFGKESICYTLSKYFSDTSYIVPTNALVQQFLEHYPKFPTLMKRSFYSCPQFEEEGFDCDYVSKKLKKQAGCGRHCTYIKDQRLARTKYIGIYNYYTYLAHKLYHKHLIVDEAHKLIGMVKDLAATHIWQCEHKYPDNTYSYGQILRWLEEKENLTPKLQLLKEAVTAPEPKYVITRGREKRYGHLEDCLKFTPLDISERSPVLWPDSRGVKTIILVSATISQVDIEELGLDKDRRVAYIEAAHSIPRERRPLVKDYIASLSFHNIPQYIPRIANRLTEIAASKDTRGFVHTTYAIAKRLRELLDPEVFVFHTKENAQDKLGKWKEGVINKQVFVGCGFSEGIDLAGEEFGWQVITKIPYPSLADPAVRYKVTNGGQLWFTWQTLRETIQMCGRISRGPEDFGETIILDGAFDRLIEEADKYDLIPKYFKEVLL